MNKEFPEEFKNITPEKFKEAFMNKVPELEDHCVREIMPGVFRIGKNGPITGRGGLKIFNEAMKEEAEKYLKKAWQISVSSVVGIV